MGIWWAHLIFVRLGHTVSEGVKLWSVRVYVRSGSIVQNKANFPCQPNKEHLLGIWGPWSLLSVPQVLSSSWTRLHRVWGVLVAISVNSVEQLCPPFVPSDTTALLSSQIFAVSVPKALFRTNVEQKTSWSVKSVLPAVFVRWRVYQISLELRRVLTDTFVIQEQAPKTQYPVHRGTTVRLWLPTPRCSTTSVMQGFTAS